MITSEPEVHSTAVVAAGARLGSGVRVGPYAVIEDGVVAGQGTEVRAHAVLKRGTTLGRGVTVHEGAVLGGHEQEEHGELGRRRPVGIDVPVLGFDGHTSIVGSPAPVRKRRSSMSFGPGPRRRGGSTMRP